MNKKVLFILTSCAQMGETNQPTGYHLAEVSHVFILLQQASVQVDFASIKGGEPPMDPSSHDTEDEYNARFLADDHVQRRLRESVKLADVDITAYDAIYFPGGHGTMWDLPHNTDVANAIRAAIDNSKMVAAVCHGPAAFVGVTLADGNPLVKDQRITCFSDEEEKAVDKDDIVPFLLESMLRQEGAQINVTDSWGDCISVSGQLITGQNPASAKSLAQALLKAVTSAD